MLKEALNFLFVPSQDRIIGLTNSVTSKFGFVDTIKSSISSIKDIINGTNAAPTITIRLNSTKYTNAGNVSIIDLSWYAPYKSYGDLVLTGFIYIFFIWRTYIHLSGIISGAAGGVENYEYISKNK